MIDQNRESREILRLGLQRSPRPIREKKKKSSLLSRGEKNTAQEVALGGPDRDALGAGDGSGDTRGRRTERAPRVVRRALAREVRFRTASRARGGERAANASHHPVQVASPPRVASGPLRASPGPGPPVPLRPRAPAPLTSPRPAASSHLRERVPGSVSRPRRARPDAPASTTAPSRLVTRKRRAANADGGISAFRPPRRSPDHPRSLISLGAEPLQNRSARWCSAT